MSSRIVLDASAALEAVLSGPSAMRILDVLAEASIVLAPDLFSSEVANSLWKYVRRGDVKAEEVIALYDAAIHVVDELVAADGLAHEALTTAIDVDHPVYDLFYAIVARRNGCSVLTLDRRLSRLLARLSIPRAEV